MNTLTHPSSRINTISATFLRFAIGFGVGALLTLLAFTAGGCGTARGLAHDISVVTATMAEDPRVEQPSPYHKSN